MFKEVGGLCAITLMIVGCSGNYGNSNNNTSGGTDPSVLSGQYAILLAGVDSTGKSLGIAGSIKADGLGNIIGGEIDVDDDGIPGTSSSVAGTYSFDTSGQNTLGTITLTNTVGSVPHPLTFAFCLQASGAFGQVMDSDTNNFVAAGTMQRQSSSVFTLASLAGDYIVAIDGRPETSPTSVLGRFTLSAGGTSSNLVFDSSVAGVGTTSVTNASVTFGAARPDANGRGTLALTIAANPSQNFAYYVIDTNRIIAVETDVIGSMTADFSRQQDSTPFTASTVATTGSIFGMAGVDITLGSDIAAAGRLVVTGVGSSTGTVSWDSNDNGNIFGPMASSGQAVAFDPSTGRGIVTIASGAAHGLADSAVFYLTSPGTGFIMDATTGLTNRAAAGTLTAQATGPFSAATDLNGLGIVRGLGAAANHEFSLVGLFGITMTPGMYAMILDDRLLFNSAILAQADQYVPGITLVSTIDATGRGTFTVPMAAGIDTNAFYVIGPNQFIYIDTSPSGSPENGPSPVFYVDPD